MQPFKPRYNARAAIFCFLAISAFTIAGCDTSPAAPTPPPTATEVVPVPTATAPVVSSPTASSQATPGAGASSTVLSGFAIPVDALAWSPDSQTLATGVGSFDVEGLPGAQLITPTPDLANFAVRLWQADGKQKAVLTGHTGSVHALAWSPDGKMLASGSADGTLRLWGPDGTPLRTINCDKGAVFAVVWSPDGSMIATGSILTTSQNTVQIWKPDGTLLHTLSTAYSGGKFYNLQWSPDGKYLVGGATDYKVWTADGTELGHTEACEHCTPSWGLGWSPDSKEWAIGDESSNLITYDLQAKQIIKVQGVASINTLAWSPDGNLIAGGVGLWRPDGIHVNDFNSTMGTGVNWLAWSPDGQTLAAGSDNKIVGLLNTLGRPKAVLKGHTDRVLKVAWSPDGKLLASSSDDRTVRIWQVGQNQ